MLRILGRLKSRPNPIIETAHFVSIATNCDHETKMLIALRGRVFGSWIQGQGPKVTTFRNHRKAQQKFNEIIAINAHGGWTLVLMRRKWRSWEHVEWYVRKFGYTENA